VLADDGLATGATATAAVRALRRRLPARIIVAMPACAPEAATLLEAEVDDLLCLTRTRYFYAVGQFYEDFSQLEDDEVERLLREAHEHHTSRATAR